MPKASSNLSPTLGSAVQVRAAAAPVGGRVDGGGQGGVGVHGVRGDNCDVGCYGFEGGHGVCDDKRLFYHQKKHLTSISFLLLGEPVAAPELLKSEKEVIHGGQRFKCYNDWPTMSYMYKTCKSDHQKILHSKHNRFLNYVVLEGIFRIVLSDFQTPCPPVLCLPPLSALLTKVLST